MDPESVRFMAREIIILRRLDHPNVMKLEGMITSRVSGSLYLIFEYMEHDLTGLLALNGVKFSEEQVLQQTLFFFWPEQTLFLLRQTSKCMLLLNNLALIKE